MTEIRIDVLRNHCISDPIPHSAILAKRPWIGGGLTHTLQLFIGTDLIEVWPAVPDHIESLGKRLIELADQLRKET